MKCSLEEVLKEEHAKSKDKRYTENIVGRCPLLDKQICLWCCLHIEGIADPSRRMNQQENGYYYTVPEITHRDWDEMWETCSTCKIKRGE